MSCCNTPSKYVRIVNRRLAQHNKNEWDILKVIGAACIIYIVSIFSLLYIMEDAVDNCHAAAKGDREVIKEIQREFGLPHK